MDNLKGSWWDDPYDSIVERMTSHWGGRAVSSMGLKAQCRAFDPGWITGVILLGVKYLLPPEGKVNFFMPELLAIFFAGGAYSQPCLEYRIYILDNKAVFS
jgi:hypothetical protein